MGRIPILICIDIEPDDRVFDPGIRKEWAGFEATFDFVEELRPSLERMTRMPVHYSWFIRMDPQIAFTYGSPGWALGRYAKLFDQLTRNGDEIGLHTHAWRWKEETGCWISDFADQNWVEDCVDMGFRTFETSFKRRCRSFRFGDRWMNNATMDFIEKRGARIDLTPEPGQTTLWIPESYIGDAPDYSDVPKTPYRPAKDNFTKRGKWRKRKLWIVPISTWTTSTLFLELDPLSMRQGVEPLLAGMEKPYLALPVRTDAALDASRLARVTENLDFILSRRSNGGFVFTTPFELIDRWL